MERNRIYGIGEPITVRSIGGSIDLMISMDKVEAVGFTALREWMHITSILENPTTPKPKVVEEFTKTLNRCVALDIEVTGMSHDFFLAGDTLTPSNNAMYARDLTEGSLYMQTLHLLEESWFTLSSLFPQVTQWEVGNEWNSDTFMHPIGWCFGMPGFTEEEKMDIAVDLMYFSAKGIRRGNPNAKVVSFSPAVAIPTLGSKAPVFCPPGYGIAQTFACVYDRIKSGNYWSDNSDDFFDMLAWHPYMLTQIMPMAASEEYPAKRRFFRVEDADAHWRAINDMVYTVMSMNGDGHKQVLLTEMGFSDWGNPELEAKQAEIFPRMFEILKSMPYVKTVHVFRLFMDRKMAEQTDPGQIGGIGEVYYGLFEESSGGYAPRKKAKVLQQLCGGTKSL